MDRKKIIIGFSLLATFLLIMVLALWSLQKEPSEELKIEQAKQEALRGSESTTSLDSGETNYTVEQNLEDGFQVVYEENEDKFTIFITKGARLGMNQEEFNNLRTNIEEYFVKNILKTEDKNIACGLNVYITTLGVGEPELPMSPLSFCEQ